MAARAHAADSQESADVKSSVKAQVMALPCQGYGPHGTWMEKAEHGTTPWEVD